MLMERIGDSDENGSNESLVHWRLAIAKAITRIATGKPTIQRRTRRKKLDLIVKTGAEFFAGLEEWHALWRHINTFASAWVTAHAAVAFFY